MGQSVDAYVAYGFALKSDGVPEEIEEFIDTYSENCGLAPSLEVGYACWGEDTRPPVIYLKNTVKRAMDGVPALFEPSLLESPSPSELEDLEAAREAIETLIKLDPYYDERWSATVGQIGWLFWGEFV